MATVGLKENNTKLKLQPPRIAPIPILPKLTVPLLTSKSTNITNSNNKDQRLQLNLAKKPILPLVNISVATPKRQENKLFTLGKGNNTSNFATKSLQIAEFRNQQNLLPPLLAQFRKPLESLKLTPNEKTPLSLDKIHLPKRTQPDLNIKKLQASEVSSLIKPNIPSSTVNNKLKLPQPTISPPSTRITTPKAPKKEQIKEAIKPSRNSRNFVLTFSDI